MDITTVLNDEALRQREFPVTKDKAFLAHAAVCPLPQRVATAMQEYTANCTKGDQEMAQPEGLMTKTREAAATLLHAKPEEIALVGPTSLGLSLIANGLNFRKHDNVVVYFDDYPSNVYPWMTLADRGVEVRFLNIRELGRLRVTDIMGQIDEQTRMVAIASCHFITGWRVELETLGKQLRAKNILFCVDGIQTLGAFPTTVEYIDFLAADAHKWLLGPCSAGILYVRRELQDRVMPTIYGWHNVKNPNFVAQEQIAFRNDARRYEAGTNNLVGIAGLHAALQLINETGVENIGHELLRKRAYLVPKLQEKGFTVMYADAAPQNSSGIVTFQKAGTDLTALHQKLMESGVQTSLRVDRKGQQYLRVSPHFYNTDEELERLVKLLG
ncbi:MAG TPA: aminotransferase class V-fold PLP-dependent enzyme [Verrucomicrobiae bacterium]